MIRTKNNVAAVAFLCLVFVIGNNRVMVESAKILGIFPTASKSHWILGSSLLKELAQDGHEVKSINGSKWTYVIKCFVYRVTIFR